MPRGRDEASTDTDALALRRPLRDVTSHRSNAAVQAYLSTKKHRHETPLIQKLAADRIAKASSSTSKRRGASRRRALPPRIVTRSFEDAERFDRALRIFSRLPILSGLSGPLPRLCGQNRGRLEIEREYPTFRMWRATDMITKHRPPYAPRMYAQHVRQLRDTLLRDLSILCAAQMAPDVDLATLFVACRPANERRPAKYVPFLQSFDLDMPKSQGQGRDGHEIDWVQHERDLAQKVKKQFAVLELLAQLALFLPDPPPEDRNHGLDLDRDLNFDHDPETLVHVLDAAKASSDMLHLVISRVPKYAPILAEYAARYARSQLFYLYPRKETPRDYTRKALENHYNAVTRLVQLDPGDKCDQQQPAHHLLEGRAILRILQAALLIQLHANVITVYESRGLVQLDDPHDMPDAYASHEAFVAVTQARRDAREAVQALYAAGRRLPLKTRSLLKDRPVAD
ncbi:hypothetical protein F5X98DRAFT_381746 [Xylaria grammica]|nr:hypothetical protein F5X98DRAFT_381746 [Xylaria grammica]